MTGVIGSGVRPCRSRRCWLLLSACAVLASFLPAKVAFALPRSHSLSSHRQRRDPGRLAGSTAILGELRHAVAAVAATYSPSSGEEWTPEEERRVMEDVLGRVPPSSTETSSLTAETRLLRQQTEELAQEIRLLREVLRKSTGAAAEPARVSPSQAAAASSFPTPAPMPEKSPVREPVAAAPAAPVQPAASPSQPAASPAPPAAATTARVVSAGHGDGNVGDFFLNDQKIDINGQSGRRGLNVVTIDPSTQQVTSRKTYDVWGEPRTENMRLSADINSMPDGRIILVACKDSGLENLDSLVFDSLRSCGARISGPLPVREGYALIGVKGGTAFAEQQGRHVEIEAGLPCFVRHPPPLPPQAPSPPAMSAQAPQGFGAPTWSQQPPAAAPPQSSFAPASAQPQSTFPTQAAPPQSTFPTQSAPPQSTFPTQAAPPQSTFPTAPPSPPPTTVRVPKLSVDPQGGVRYDDDMVEREGRPEEDGQSWQEVVLMLDRLQEKIKAKRLSAV